MSRAYLYAVVLAALVLAVPLASGAASDLPPTPTIDSAPPNPSATGSATFSFSDADPLVTFRCQIDGGAFSLCTSPATYSALGDGSHTFGVKAVDVLLNESDVVSYTWSVDTTPPPAPTITAQPSNPSNDSSPAFQFTDTEGGVSFQCKLDLGGFATCASPAAYTGQADGSHTFTVQAIDAAGNTSSRSYSWAIDTVVPTITLGTKPPSSSSDATPTFAFSANEATPNGFECKLDSGAFSACTSPTTLGPTPDGNHTFIVRATDAAGNTGQASYTWTIDTVAPTVTLGTTPPNPSNDPTPGFSFSANEGIPGGFECKLDNGAFAACTSPMTLGSTADGSHTYTVKATDAAGNAGQASYVWTIDTVAPTATLTAKPANPSNDPTPSFSFSASETSTFQCQLDAGAFAPCTSPTTLGSTADGSHTYTVKATDAAGNTGPVTSYVWTIDTVAPTVTLNIKPPNPTNDTTPDFAFSANEPISGRLPVPARRSRLRRLHQPEDTRCDRRRVAYLHRKGDRRGRKHRADELHLDDRYGGAADHSWHQADESHQRHRRRTSPSARTRRSWGASSASSTVAPSQRARARRHFLQLRTGRTPSRSRRSTRPETLDRRVTPGRSTPVAPTITLGTKPVNPANDSTPAFAFSANEPISGGFQCKLDAGRLRRLHEPEDIRCDPRRIAHLHGQGERHRGKHRADDLHLDDRHRSADDHADRAAAEPLQRRNADLHLQRRRGHARRLPVQARRRRLRRLHEPEDIRYDPRRIAHLHGQGRRLGGQQQLDELRVDDRHDRARPDSHEDAGGPQWGGHRALRVQRY